MIFVVFYPFLAQQGRFKDKSYNSKIIKLYDSNFFLIGEQMGAILCIRSAWPQDSPRDTVAMHGSLFGESSQGDCADLFCLACENRGQILKLQTNNDDNNIFEYDKASLGSDGSVSEYILQEKLKSQSRSNKINPNIHLPSMQYVRHGSFLSGFLADHDQNEQKGYCKSQKYETVSAKMSCAESSVSFKHAIR